MTGIVDAAVRTSWTVVGASQRGAMHRRKKLLNQDYWHSWSVSAVASNRVVAAVADGHGDLRHFRSDEGAQFAARRAVAAMVESTDNLETRIVEMWSRRVEQELLTNPIQPRELEALAAQRDAETADEVARRPAIAYGSTVIAASAGREEVVVAMLGDGAAVAVAQDGSVSDLVPVDERFRFGSTASLCDERAAELVRCARIPVGAADPALVLLATDGFSDSYEPAGFRSQAASFANLARSMGSEGLRSELPGWLKDLSDRGGSGDDTTVVLLLRDPRDARPSTEGAGPATNG